MSTRQGQVCSGQCGYGELQVVTGNHDEYSPRPYSHSTKSQSSRPKIYSSLKLIVLLSELLAPGAFTLGVRLNLKGHHVYISTSDKNLISDDSGAIWCHCVVGTRQSTPLGLGILLQQRDSEWNVPCKKVLMNLNWIQFTCVKLSQSMGFKSFLVSLKCCTFLKEAIQMWNTQEKNESNIILS